MHLFTNKDIKKIANCLGVKEIGQEKDHSRLKIVNPKEKRGVVLEIYPQVSEGRKKGAMVVVYAGNSHLQLHNCSGYVLSKELGEVTFVGESGDKISGLVIEKEAACSLYANVVRDLISSDFTKLGVEVMFSGVALSLAEEVLGKKKKK
ncbi:MAG: hypothetical protein MUO85_10305 [candidate division Zixibacteria bacterium]|nr:hypothetical protein [candidate division Zixibacteria bacterium]